MLRLIVLLLCYIYWPLSIAVLAMQASTLVGVVFFLIFTHTIHLINTVAAHMIRDRVAQIPVALAAVSYIAWSAFIYIEAFHRNPDPQSPIALLFIGVYALPVMVPLWLIALWRQESVKPPMGCDEERHL